MDTVKTKNGHSLSSFELGDTIDYKIKPGRGRPQKGVLLEKRKRTVLVATGDGEKIEVPSEKVLGLHVTKYSERQRRLL